MDQGTRQVIHRVEIAKADDQVIALVGEGQFIVEALRRINFLYRDTAGGTFMDRESFEQHCFDLDALEAELPYLTEGLEGIFALVVDGTAVGIELPATVVLEVMECAPAMKAASASARNKPATLSTGLVVQVPEYLASGEMIKVNTLTGDFMSRA